MLLLVVLGLLAMFGLVGLMFVLNSGQQRQASEATRRVDQYADPGKQLLFEAFAQVVRGTREAAPPTGANTPYIPRTTGLGAHNLLEGMYGNTSRVGVLTAGTRITAVAGNGGANGQIWELTPNASPNPVNNALEKANLPAPLLGTRLDERERCVGCVLTFLNGPAAGISTRILRYIGQDPTHPQPVFQILVTEEMPDLQTMNNFAGNNSNPPVSFLVNGVPFSGTGFGFNPNGNLLDMPSITVGSGQYPLALLPNDPWTKHPPTVSVPYGQGTFVFGGANSDYTAPDYQHMLLALTLGYRLTSSNIVSSANAGTYNTAMHRGVAVPIPSLWRSDLVSYWASRTGGVAGNTLSTYNFPTDSNIIKTARSAFGQMPADLQRAISMRPTPADHPMFFNRTNTRFNPFWDGRASVGGCEWDVDNDGDGVADSVWVDLGMPVRTFRDGRTYKPLFAILCQDLDGRLNLNAHGSNQELNMVLLQSMSPSATAGTVEMDKTGTPNVPHYIFLDGQNTSSVSRGMGYGPADISVEKFLSVYGTLSDPKERMLMLAKLGNSRDYDSAASYYVPPNTYPAPVPRPGRGGSYTPLRRNRFFEYAEYYWLFHPLHSQTNQGSSTYFDAFGTPPDLYGIGAVALDLGGQPMFCQMGHSINTSYYPSPSTAATGTTPIRTINTPYERNLSRRPEWRGVPSTTQNASSMSDNPFTPGELENLFRWFDGDNGMLGRRLNDVTDVYYSVTPLQTKSSSAGSCLGAAYRNDVTTESWDPPCPSIALPMTPRMLTAHRSDSVLAGGQGQLPAQLALHPIDLLRSLDPSGDRQGSQLPEKNLEETLPPELLAGLPMDLNRPFGNGRKANYSSTGVTVTPYTIDDPGIKYAPNNPPPYAASSSGGNWLYREAVNNSQQSMPVAYATSVPFDLNNGQRQQVWDSLKQKNVPNENYVDTGLKARQIYARHLYVLACLLVDNNGLENFAAPKYPHLTREKAAARVLAQWAVNVVDFRDRDSIMTLFQYDPNFYQQVKDARAGKPTSSAPAWDPSNALNTGVNVVFGCERPDLLITETLAFHDRRTENLPPQGKKTPTDNGVDANTIDPGPSGQPDPDFDQRLKPQGSLFVELYNPWDDQSAPDPYMYAATTPKNGDGKVHWGLKLNQVTPAKTPNGTTQNQCPVWRMIVCQAPTGTSGTAAFPDPDEPPGASVTPLPIERSIYFAGPTYVAKVPKTATEKLQHCPSSTRQGQIAPILPGRYAVIGPPNDAGSTTSPATTFIGFDTAGATKSTGDATKDRYIQLNPSATIDEGAAPSATTYPVRVANNQYASDLADTTNRVPGMKPPVAVVIDNVMSGTSGTAQRLSVSEPTTVPAYSGSFPASPALDTPLDTPSSLEDYKVGTPFDLTYSHTSTVTPNTTPFRMLHLQRLADPTRPFNIAYETSQNAADLATYNPYRTIDSMPIYLTAFNGLVPYSKDTKSYDCDPKDKACTDGDNLRNVKLVAVERGVGGLWGSVETNNIWRQGNYPGATISLPNPFSGPSSSGWMVTTNGLPFQRALVHTLGYLNNAYSSGNSQNPGPSNIWPGTAPQTRYKGDVKVTNVTTGNNTSRFPFPWFTWNNRPFVSHLELMLVPFARSSQLLNFQNVSLMPSNSLNPYGAAGLPTNTTVPFFHLTNFFHSSNSPMTSAMELHRVLDYVRVPSPFVGTATELDPRSPGVSTPYNPNTPNPDTAHRFHPPFNWVSSYRDPGRINLNTLASGPNGTSMDHVWNALMNGYPGYGYDWGGTGGANMWYKFIHSRRGGYNPTVPSGQNAYLYAMLSINPALNGSNVVSPTRFESPFRSSGGFNRQFARVPIRELAPNLTTPQQGMSREVDATLLREDFTKGWAGHPLLELNTTSGGSSTTTNPPQPGRNQANNPTNPYRNAFFHHHGLQRLGNLTTTRSNVYAIWITVGYFEAKGYDPANPALASGNQKYNEWIVGHPDGWELGPELGIDTGEVTRHRAFFIFDRTVPVGFVRGEDINHEKATLIKRFIE